MLAHLIMLLSSSQIHTGQEGKWALLKFLVLKLEKKNILDNTRLLELIHLAVETRAKANVNFMFIYRLPKTKQFIKEIMDTLSEIMPYTLSWET